jgi:hypothetical protein
MDTGFWIFLSACGGLFLAAVVVEHWLMARKRRQQQAKTAAVDPGAGQPEAAD